MGQLVFKGSAFICPLCHVFSTQDWRQVHDPSSNPMPPVQDLWFSKCLHCKEKAIWYKERLIAPVATKAPLPNDDMPADVKIVFGEASSVSELSPRSAVILLRVCAQMLCSHLGKSPKLNEGIPQLIKDGVPSEIKIAFESLQLAGNSQAHPDDSGSFIENDPKLVSLLFSSINTIVHSRFTVPREAREFHQQLLTAREERKQKNHA